MSFRYKTSPLGGLVSEKGNVYMVNRFILSFLIVFVFSGGMSDWAKASGKPEEGESVYRTNCENCHGTHGKGDGKLAGELTPPPADLSSARVQNQQDHEILETILRGRPGTSMPSWKNDLSTKQTRDVLAFIRTFAQKR